MGTNVDTEICQETAGRTSSQGSLDRIEMKGAGGGGVDWGI